MMRRVGARFNRQRIHSGRVLPNLPPSWAVATSAFAGWRSDLGMAYSAGASMTWTDQVGGSTLSQGTGANVPVYGADANWGGLPSLSFDGSNDSLTSSLAAASWAFLSDGSGATVLFVYRPDSTAAASNGLFYTGNSATGKGANAYWENTNDRVVYSVSDGATNVITISGTANSQVQDTKCTMLVTHLTASTPDATLYGSPVTTSRGTASGVVAAGAPVSTLLVGQRGGGLFLKASVVEIAFWARELSGAERTALSAYTLAQYGVA